MITIENPDPRNFSPPVLHVMFFGYDSPVGSINQSNTKGALVDTVFNYNSDNGMYEYNHPTMGWVRFDNPSEFDAYVQKIHKIYWS